MEKIGDENDRATMHKDFLLWATEHEGVVFWWISPWNKTIDQPVSHPLKLAKGICVKATTQIYRWMGCC